VRTGNQQSIVSRRKAGKALRPVQPTVKLNTEGNTGKKPAAENGGPEGTTNKKANKEVLASNKTTNTSSGLEGKKRRHFIGGE